MVEEEDEDWITTHAGYKYNHKFGYGKLDAYRIVHAAKDFKTVKPQAWFHSPVLAVGQSIPENDQGLISTFTITKDMLQKANLEKIEHVTVKMNLRHDRRGDVSVELVSPTGVVSKIAVPRESDTSKSGYKEWTFMSVVHW
jgi:kexin